jgi:hypothetical protein
MQQLTGKDSLWDIEKTWKNVECNIKFCSERQHQARKAWSVGSDNFGSYELRSGKVKIYWGLMASFSLWDDSRYRWWSWPADRLYHLSNDHTAPPPLPWRLKTWRYNWRQLSAAATAVRKARSVRDTDHCQVLRRIFAPSCFHIELLRVYTAAIYSGPASLNLIPQVRVCLSMPSELNKSQDVPYITAHIMNSHPVRKQRREKIRVNFEVSFRH